MMFDDCKDKIREEKDFFSRKTTNFRMGEVTGLSNGRPVIKFYGESENSKKMYKYLSSYTPAAGDRVLVVSVGGTCVIIGKVV